MWRKTFLKFLNWTKIHIWIAGKTRCFKEKLGTFFPSFRHSCVQCLVPPFLHSYKFFCSYFYMCFFICFFFHWTEQNKEFIFADFYHSELCLNCFVSYWLYFNFIIHLFYCIYLLFYKILSYIETNHAWTRTFYSLRAVQLPYDWPEHKGDTALAGLEGDHFALGGPASVALHTQRFQINSRQAFLYN